MLSSTLCNSSMVETNLGLCKCCLSNTMLLLQKALIPGNWLPAHSPVPAFVTLMLWTASEFWCSIHKAISLFHSVLNYPFAAKETRSKSKEYVFAIATAPLQQQFLSLSQTEIQLQAAWIKEFTVSKCIVCIYRSPSIKIHTNTYTCCKRKQT